MLASLGSGQFGTVWLGEGPPKAPKRVAIKQLRGEWSLAAFETLVHEFELLGRVKHRSLCKVYEFVDRDMAVVMEFVEGATLRDVIDAFKERSEPLWPEAVIEIGCELADCLYQVHATPGADGEPLGLVHRDVKPENVMITPRGEVKLLDFGLAAIDRPSWQEEGSVGTPVYMAPEQARGLPVSHATDLFALGLLLAELLTEEPVYKVPEEERDSQIEALLETIRTADVQHRVRDVLEDLPKLSRVIRRCLAARPEDRPQDGHALLVELRKCRGAEARGALQQFCGYAFSPEGPLPDPRDNPHFGQPIGRGRQRADSQRGRAMPGDADDRRPPRPGAAPPRPGPSGGANGLTQSVRAGLRERPRATARPPARPPQMYQPPEQPEKRPPRVVKPVEGQDLRMVPLHQEGSDPELGEGLPPGDTSFFAMPKPLPTPEPKPSKKPPAAPPPGAGPVGPVPGVIGPTPMGNAPVGIQGPVAGGPVAVAPVAGMQAPPMAPDGGRAQSYRVFAILIGLMFMVCSVLAITAVLTVYGLYWANQSDTASNSPPPPPQVVATPQTDTAVPPSRPKPPPRPTSRPRPRAAPVAPAPVVPKVVPGTVKITLAPGSPPFTGVEIKCTPSGFRSRVSFVNGSAKITDVPAGEACSAYFKGGPPAKGAVSAGDDVTCSFAGPTANCG